jgi:hypothetical protein
MKMQEECPARAYGSVTGLIGNERFCKCGNEMWSDIRVVTISESTPGSEEPHRIV